MWFEIILGILPAAAVFGFSRKFFLSRKPVVTKVRPTAITPIIESYRQRQLALESPNGGVPTKAIETKDKKQPVKKDKAPVAVTVAEQNYTEWGLSKSNSPIVQAANSILETLAEISKLDMGIENAHNIEVLSNQTKELNETYFATPESLRKLPDVESSLGSQLSAISKAVESLKIDGTEGIIRKLQVGTEFINSKFHQNEQLKL